MELEFGQDVVGGRRVGRQFVGVVAIGRHGDAPSSDSAACAAFTAIT
jgi:hypothetical protein